MGLRGMVLSFIDPRGGLLGEAVRRRQWAQPLLLQGSGFGLGQGSGSAPAGVAASWGPQPAAAPAAVSPLSGSGELQSPASQTSSHPLRQIAAGVYGTSWAGQG